MVKRIILKPGEEDRIRRGHPWVYGSEVAGVLQAGPSGPVPAELKPGETADIESSRREYLGRAFVNPSSKILARIYSPSKEGADKGFFKRRIREALERRLFAGLDPRRDSLRLVFAEADFLPGLIIDRFTGWPAGPVEALLSPPGAASVSPRTEGRPGFESLVEAQGPPKSWLVVQFLCAGMEVRRDLILDALGEVFAGPEAPEGILEKSAPVRELEGLPLRDGDVPGSDGDKPGEGDSSGDPIRGILRGSIPPGGIVIFENGIPFALDLPGGQKTGHFLDQRENHALAAAFAPRLVPGGETLRVLDAFSYTGGFGIHICRPGLPAELWCVDSSGPALEGVRRNAALNGLPVRTIRADVFDYLREAERRKEQFDLIILDPPAFAKNRASLPGALRGYREINLRALTLLSPGGLLVTCSCSQALGPEQFRRMITDAAADAGRRIHELAFRSQPPDHPILAGYDESRYLTCGFYRVGGGR